MNTSEIPIRINDNSLLLITRLSADVQSIISSFLRTKDALEYSTTCKSIHQSLNFRTIADVNTIHYHQHKTQQPSKYVLCKEIFPSFPMIGRHAVHSYRIRCNYKEVDCYYKSQTFFVKTEEGKSIAALIVDCDNRDVVLMPPDVNQKYFLCHYQEDEDVEITFGIDILARGIQRFEEKEEGNKGLKRRLSSIICD